MTQPQLIFLFSVPFYFAFSAFLFYFGRSLFRMTSLKKECEMYRKAPGQANFFQKYLLGFALWNIKAMEWTVKAFGDKPVTLWYRFSGAFFILLSVFFVLATFLLFYFQFLS